MDDFPVNLEFHVYGPLWVLLTAETREDACTLSLRSNYGIAGGLFSDEDLARQYNQRSGGEEIGIRPHCLDSGPAVIEHLNALIRAGVLWVAFDPTGDAKIPMRGTFTAHVLAVVTKAMENQ